MYSFQNKELVFFFFQVNFFASYKMELVPRSYKMSLGVMFSHLNIFKAKINE